MDNGTSGKAWLKFRLYWEGERETPEVENEYLFFGVEDARVRGAERGVDLFDGRRHRRRRRGRNVKVDTTIPDQSTSNIDQESNCRSEVKNIGIFSNHSSF